MSVNLQQQVFFQKTAKDKQEGVATPQNNPPMPESNPPEQKSTFSFFQKIGSSISSLFSISSLSNIEDEIEKSPKDIDAKSKIEYLISQRIEKLEESSNSSFLSYNNRKKSKINHLIILKNEISSNRIQNRQQLEIFINTYPVIVKSVHTGSRLSKTQSLIDQIYKILPDEDQTLGEKITSTGEPRILALDGGNGTVFTKVHEGIFSATIPRISEAGVVECATRTHFRLINLVAVRGQPGSSMIGPTDCFGSLENPHMYGYTIDIFCGVPTIRRILAQNIVPSSLNKQLPTNQHTVTVEASWISGTETEKMEEVKEACKEKGKTLVLGNSLFSNFGVLFIKSQNDLILPNFDATQLDLSEYGAQLVPNHIPFQITTKELKASDFYRVISYVYEDGYTNQVVNGGGGLFLEFHEFAQTMTPLHHDAKGFVTLAKWDEEHMKLNIIPVQIPYGWTLIVHGGCIHGDATLSGRFLMTMTSDHTTMQTADTVFLKKFAVGGNIGMTLAHDSNSALVEIEINSSEFENDVKRPLVVYDGNNYNSNLNKLYDTTDKFGYNIIQPAPTAKTFGKYSMRKVAATIGSTTYSS